MIATGPADGQIEERALELGADDYAFMPHTQKSLWRKAMRAMDAASHAENKGGCMEAGGGPRRLPD